MTRVRDFYRIVFIWTFGGSMLRRQLHLTLGARKAAIAPKAPRVKPVRYRRTGVAKERLALLYIMVPMVMMMLSAKSCALQPTHHAVPASDLFQNGSTTQGMQQSLERQEIIASSVTGVKPCTPGRGEKVFIFSPPDMGQASEVVGHPKYICDTGSTLMIMLHNGNWMKFPAGSDYYVEGS